MKTQLNLIYAFARTSERRRREFVGFDVFIGIEEGKMGGAKKKRMEEKLGRWRRIFGLIGRSKGFIMVMVNFQKML